MFIFTYSSQLNYDYYRYQSSDIRRRWLHAFVLSVRIYTWSCSHSVAFLNPNPISYCEGHFTTESDVHCFGVVLLVILTGLKPVDPRRSSEKLNLVFWVERCLGKEHGISDIMDKDIEGQYTEKAALCASSLAIKCTSRDFESRPSAYQVVDELQQLLASVNLENSHGRGIKSWRGQK